MMPEWLPLETLYDRDESGKGSLPLKLSGLYGGDLRFPQKENGPWIIGNIVTTLDGVVSLGIPGRSGGDEISGSNPRDRMVMGLLRSASDLVIVGAGTLRATPLHQWTPGYIFPELAGDYHAYRKSLGKRNDPVTVIVTGSGDIDFQLPAFQSSDSPPVILTTREGVKRLRSRSAPESIEIVAIRDSGKIKTAEILKAVSKIAPAGLILIEGGPHMMGDFLGEHFLNELFLTLSPQIAGRDGGPDRPGLAAGRLFAPDQPLWAGLQSAKRGGEHLFLRYRF
jgi:riboflavin biosynthesis pyrimidine reductase